MNTTITPTTEKKTKNLVLIFESFIIGSITGLVIVAFRFGIHYITELRTQLYPLLLTKNPLVMLCFIAVLCGIGLLIGGIITEYPITKGSGVAQLEGVFMKKLRLSPWPELPFKFIGGIFCIGLGLSVGREGPSVHLGAYIGDSIERIKKSSFLDKIYLITAGAAAGLSATFNAPFTGVVFAIEDLHRYFNPLLLTCIMTGSFAADFVASTIFGAGPLFHFQTPQHYPLNQFVWLIGLGILMAMVGHLFKQSIYFFQKCYKKLHIPSYTRPLIPFVLTLPIGFWCILITGGGDELIDALATQSFSYKMLIGMLCAKIVFTGISAGSGAIGGIFVPLLSCGALAGTLYAQILINFGILEPDFAIHLLLFGMAACFTTVIKAPLSACALIVETNGSIQHLGSLVLTCLTAYITANLIGSQAHDEVLLAQFLNMDSTTEEEINE